MKKLILLSVSVLTFTIIISAQPCKQVKPGMTMSDVKVLFGNPDEISVLGTDSNSGAELSIWHYGNQRVSFNGSEVESVVADGKGQDELFVKFRNNLVTKEELTVMLEELNRKACE